LWLVVATTLGASPSSSGVPHTNINTPAMILTYGRVLSTIEKAFQELVEEYWGVGKSLWNLVEGQKRNTAQLERIGAVIE